jgi:hypothetical protein
MAFHHRPPNVFSRNRIEDPKGLPRITRMHRTVCTALGLGVILSVSCASPSAEEASARRRSVERVGQGNAPLQGPDANEVIGRSTAQWERDRFLEAWQNRRPAPPRPHRPRR